MGVRSRPVPGRTNGAKPNQSLRSATTCPHLHRNHRSGIRTRTLRAQAPGRPHAHGARQACQQGMRCTYTWQRAHGHHEGAAPVGPTTPA